MTLAQLEYALAVETHLSFSRAAKACHITQPSLSAQIQKLEDELGVLIFDRSRSPVVVTDVGRELLHQARIALDESHRMLEIAQNSQNIVKGTFRLGVIPTVGPDLLPLFLNSFSRHFPDVHLIVEEDKTAHLISKLDRGLLDGAILSTPEEAPASLLERPLYYESFLAFVGLSSPLAEKTRLSMRDLPLDQAILLDDTHCMRDQVTQICQARKQSTTGSVKRFDFQGGSLQTLMGLVENSDSYTFVPQLTTQGLSATKRTKHIRAIERPTPVRKISLIYHRAHLKRGILDALSKEILSNLPQDLVRKPRNGLHVLDPSPSQFEVGD